MAFQKSEQANDLQVSEGFAWLGIAISGAFAVLTSLTISVMACSMNRKTLLVGLTAPVAWWSWLAKTLPQDAEAGSGLMVALIQLAIALGSSVGGLLFDESGYKSTVVASAAVLLIDAFLTFLTARPLPG